MERSPGDILETQNLIQPDTRPKFIKYLGLHTTQVQPQIIAAFALVKKICRHFGFPYMTFATAMTLIHRYVQYTNYNRSFSDLAITCLFSATKIEETVKKSREYLIVALKIVRGIEYDDLDHPDLLQYRQFMLGFERDILQTCSFRFDIVHPHRLMLKIIKRMDLEDDFAMNAWIILEDCYHLPLCISYPPVAITAGVIYLTARLLNPFDPQTHRIAGRHWTEYFRSNLGECLEVARQIALLLSTKNDSVVEYKDILIDLNKLIQLQQSRQSSREQSKQSSRKSSISQDSNNWDRRVQRFEGLISKRKSPVSYGHSQPPLKRKSPSPPRRRRSPSPVYQRKGRSPHSRNHSPLRYQKSPVNYRRRSPTPLKYQRRRSPSPMHINQRRRSPSPRRRRSPSPHIHNYRRRSPASNNYRKRSPPSYRRSPAHYRQRTPSPGIHRRSPVDHRKRTPPPQQYRRNVGQSDYYSRRRSRSRDRKYRRN